MPAVVTVPPEGAPASSTNSDSCASLESSVRDRTVHSVNPFAFSDLQLNKHDVKHSNTSVPNGHHWSTSLPGDQHTSCPPSRRTRLEGTVAYSLLYPQVSLLPSPFTFESVPSSLISRLIDGSVRASAWTQHFRGTCHFVQVACGSLFLIDSSERVFKGYNLTSLETFGYGLVANLVLAGEECNAYGTDYKNLVVEVTYESTTR